MILQRRLEEIQYSDVEDFCAQELAAEGRFFEYKREIPSSLPKIIASLANTYGGLVIIGIDTDKRNMPIWPPVGMNYDKGIEERISGICLRSIDPPVVPDVKVFPIESDASKCIAMIRVYESSLSPHSIENRTKVYVRVNSMSEPVQADLDTVKWLSERREAAVNLRESLKHGVVERFKKEFKAPTNLTNSVIQFHLLPRYPHSPLLHRSKLNAAIKRIGHWDYVTSIWNDSAPTFSAVRAGIGIWPSGRDNSGNRKLPYHWEFNAYGGTHAVFTWPAESVNLGNGKIVSCFDVSHFSWRAGAFFKMAHRWLSVAEFRGSLDFKVQIDGAWNLPLYYFLRMGPKSDEVLKASPMGQCKEPQAIEASASSVLVGDDAESSKPFGDALESLLWDLGCPTMTAEEAAQMREICDGATDMFCKG